MRSANFGSGGTIGRFAGGFAGAPGPEKLGPGIPAAVPPDAALLGALGPVCPPPAGLGMDGAPGVNTGRLPPMG